MGGRPVGERPLLFLQRLGAGALGLAAVNVGVGTTNPDSPFTVVGTAASAAASSLTLAQPWKAQHVISATGSPHALKLGSHYTLGATSYGSIQASEFYSGTEHPGIISLNPLGGFVGIGITNPEGPLHVHSAIRASDRSLNGGAGVTLTAAAGTGYGSIECYNTANTAKLPIVLQGWGGNVGIGVTNPGAAFQVYNGASSYTVPTASISDGPADLGWYGMLQLTRPGGVTDAKGHLSIVRNGHAVTSMGYFPGSNAFGITQSNNMNTSSGLWLSSGNIGIGITNPICALHVETYSFFRTANVTSINSGNGYYFGYWTGLNKVEGWSRDWDFNCSIFARSSIWTLNHIISASDERIKKNIEPVQGALDKIRRLDVVSYDRIDYRERGVNAGVLARNVRDILPKAVHASNQTIPNIYLPATHLKIQSGVLIEVKCDDKDIKEGSKVKLMIMQGDKEVEHISNMTNWTGSSFEVEEWKEYSEEDKVFAYGVEVDDFLNVDKEQIGILAAGAVKELVQVVEDLTAKSDAQSREISELKRLVGSLLR